MYGKKKKKSKTFSVPEKRSDNTGGSSYMLNSGRLEFNSFYTKTREW